MSTLVKKLSVADTCSRHVEEKQKLRSFQENCWVRFANSSIKESSAQFTLCVGIIFIIRKRRWKYLRIREPQNL